MSKRPIKPIMLGDLVPGEVKSSVPEIKWMSPGELLVDEDYQRGLSDRSVTLIRRIIAGWDWARFKPPVVAETDDGIEVIDGQHTAIAAASHPDIAEIPVLVVRAESKADRAKAFVGHNKDRLGITATQMHHSAVAAGDDDALTVNQVCERAGLRILRNPPANGHFKPKDTMAVAGIASLINRRGALGARKVLQVLADANCAPVGVTGIRAVETLLHETEFDGIAGEDITNTLIRLGPDADHEAKVFAATHKVPGWRALAIVLFRATRKRRKVA